MATTGQTIPLNTLTGPATPPATATASGMQCNYNWPPATTTTTAATTTAAAPT